jgi:hypothetical protein
VRGQCEGKDEHEHRRDRPFGDVPAKDAEEQYESGRDTCDNDGQPGGSRAQRADRDEEGADNGESRVGDGATPQRSAEVGEQQHREGADGGEGRDLRVFDDLVSERE